MDAQAIVWFGIGGGAAVFALSLLYQRFIQKLPKAVTSGSSFVMFAGMMVAFAVFAIVAGILRLNA
jgi:xanthine/uracil permease